MGWGAVATARSTRLAYDDLRDWIRTLEKHGELKRIREEVSPELEITEITDRVSKIGSPGSESVAACSGNTARWSTAGGTRENTLPAGRRCCLRT